ncbi:MAG TPA: hypothetical protein VGB99_05615 [Acidobacteriota bacterium]
MTWTILLRTAYLLMSLVAPDWAPAMAWVAEPVEERPVTYPSSGAPIHARLYQPQRAGERAGLVLTHGMAWAGMDDPRIVTLARRLAECGFVVLTPDLDPLKRFQLSIHSADQIRDAALYLQALPRVYDDRVGLFGLSYAGSLSFIAAAAPELRGRLRWVTSFGGYWDFEELVRYTLTGSYRGAPAAALLEPQLYGRLAIYYNYPELLEAGLETEAFKEICYWGLHHDYDRADALRDSLSRGGRAILRSFWGMSGDNPCVGHERFQAWRAERGPYLRRMALASWIDQVRLPEAFLLHSEQDSLVPAVESRLLADALRRRGTKVHLEITPLFHHIDALRGDAGAQTVLDWRRLRQVWSLYRFFVPLLALAQDPRQ